jgi:hypothetical protein
MNPDYIKRSEKELDDIINKLKNSHRIERYEYWKDLITNSDGTMCLTFVFGSAAFVALGFLLYFVWVGIGGGH